MKKILAMVMAMAMVLSLAACGGGDKSSASAGSASAGSAGSAGAASTADGADFKVGAIYINSKNDTAGYTFAHHNGITTAMKELGMDPATQLVIVDEVPEDKEQVLAAIDTLVGEGANIIFGISFGYIDAMAEAAEEYPDVVFSHATGYMCNDTNFNNYWGAIYQARYLSGIVAGLKTKANLIGYVGSMNNPEVNGGLNAFALGVKSVNSDAKIYVKYTGTWYDVTLEKQTAEALLDLGCDVLGQHCDTSMPMVAAEERGAYGIGYNAVISEGEPGYKAWMTAPVWDWSAVLVSEVQSVIDGTWKPENVFFGLKEGLVSLAPLTDAAPAGAQELIDAATAKMVSGEWDVFTGPITDNQGNVVIAEGETVHYNANFGSEMTWLLDNIEAR